MLDRTFNYNPRRAKELLRLFLEFSPDIRFHLEIHPALLSEELKEELKQLPAGLLHLEAVHPFWRQAGEWENSPMHWKD